MTYQVIVTNKTTGHEDRLTFNGLPAAEHFVAVSKPAAPHCTFTVHYLD